MTAWVWPSSRAGMIARTRIRAWPVSAWDRPDELTRRGGKELVAERGIGLAALDRGEQIRFGGDAPLGCLEVQAFGGCKKSARRRGCCAAKSWAWFAFATSRRAIRAVSVLRQTRFRSDLGEMLQQTGRIDHPMRCSRSRSPALPAAARAPRAATPPRRRAA